MDLPEDYKRGFKDFLGVRIDLSKKPLIPRDETEYWVNIAIEEIKEGAECLDLFAGSGCIGVSILKNIKNSFCDFGEKEDLFLEQIKISLDLNNINKERYDLIKTDVFSNIKKKYDYILANPPYVAEDRIDEVGEDVKMFEPSIALYGGDDGMEYIKIFLNEAIKYLKDNGIIYLEFDPEQKDSIEEIINGKYSRFEFLKDQFNKYRFIKIEK
ncbi:MAG TPA: HemK family protein methyltransferase [Candidatus Pacearchaeota archaeon]|nr:HemK family protein methyltransferase [Candidatus Pacearchaeota archaeon]HPR80000.1 HemK family protein methyltransferase [Candidatus Pacearchaeota archaeon]